MMGHRTGRAGRASWAALFLVLVLVTSLVPSVPVMGQQTPPGGTDVAQDEAQDDQLSTQGESDPADAEEGSGDAGDVAEGDDVTTQGEQAAEGESAADTAEDSGDVESQTGSAPSATDGATADEDTVESDEADGDASDSAEKTSQDTTQPADKTGSQPDGPADEGSEEQTSDGQPVDDVQSGTDQEPTATSELGEAVGAIGSFAVAPSSEWVTDVSRPTNGGVGVDATRTLTFGGVGVSATETTTAVTPSLPPPICQMIDNTGIDPSGPNTAGEYTEPDPDPASSQWAASVCGSGAERQSTVEFSAPVVAPILHINNLEASRLIVGGTDIEGNPITIETIVANEILDVSGTTINDSFDSSTNQGCFGNGADTNGGCGSFRLVSPAPIESFTLTNNNPPKGDPPPPGSGDSWSWTMSFPTAPLTKAFAPTSIAAGETSELTFSLSNPDEAESITLAPLDFTDTLPSGLTLANESVTDNGNCGVPAVNITTGGTSIEAADISVDPGDACTITVTVTADEAGTYVNDNSNVSTAVANIVPDLDATLTVTAEQLPAFECAPTAYLFQDVPVDVWEGDLVTGSFSETASNIEDTHLNGIGYNPLDNYIYGWSNSAQPGGTSYPTGLVRVGSDYSVEYLGIPDGLTEATLIGHGDVDTDGHYWARRTDTVPEQWVEIDLEPGSPTFGEVLDNGPLSLPTGITFLNPDWSFNPTDGLLYGIADGPGGAKHLISFDRSTHQVSDEGALGLPGGFFGAAYMDADGFLYVSDNATGEIYRIDTADATASFFAQGPGDTGQNDGARCALAPLPIDFGDAPNSYGTLLADDGPRHAVPGLDAGTAPLMLGSSIDIESDGAPGAVADGDGGDDDGVADPIVLVGGQSTTVSVDVTNDTGEPATLAGWIDLNNDGDFDDAGELVSADVPASSGLDPYDLVFDPATFPAGGTYARFRLFPGAVDDADLSPVGPAAAGEVEDYPVEGPLPPPFQCVSGQPGLLFQYPAAGEPTNMHAIDLVTGAQTTPATADAYSVNAIGYNVLDDYVYGWSTTTQELVRVGSDGSVDTSIPQPDGVPVMNFLVGDVDDQGHYWVWGNGAWYDIDLATGATTSQATPLPTGLVAGYDWAYVPGTDTVWMVARNADDESVLIGLNRSTGDWTTPVNLGVIGDQDGTDVNALVGAMFVDADGNLYASYNATGEIWRIDVEAGTADFFSPGPSSDGNDGARCAAAPILVDFGDAPDSYGTTLGADGPRHSVNGYDADANTAPLMLGTAIDPDNDGLPGGDAAGDDADGPPDEDGVVEQIVTVVGEPTAVDVEVTNDTGELATLVGWIDGNDNGVFEDSERQSVVVPANSGTTTQTLTFPAPAGPGDGTFARFRLFPGEVTEVDQLPTGPAAGGEVEDYAVVGPIPVQISCPSVYAAQGSSPYNFYEMDTATGAMSSVGSLNLGGGTNNALGFSAGGQYLFSYLSGSPGSVVRYDTFTGDVDQWSGSINSATHGAVDASTGIYYYGTVGTGSGTVYAFDTNTETDLGQVATIDWDVAAAGGNGDWAFDSQGNLYVVAGAAPTNPLYVVSEALPTTAQGSPVTVTGQQLSVITGGSDAINGVAFDGDGYLYLASNQSVRQVHPSSGQVEDTQGLSPAGESVDLGSCATPATITVVKDIVERAVDGDQFEVSVTGGGIAQNNVGTTTGSDLGVQDEPAEEAGPVLALPGETYDIAEAGAAGATLGNYDIAWECVNTGNNDAVVASGTGAAGSFTMPASVGGFGASVVCTFTNAPVETDIDKELVDTVSNGDGSYTLTYELTVSRTGDGSPYDLDDELTYGDAVTVDAVTAANTQPGGIATETDFDGQGNTLVANDVPIADGETHVYEVVVDATVDGEAVTFENSDCDLEQGESGTGFANTATVTVNDVQASDDACEEIPATLVDKTTTSEPAPTGTGTYELEYTITATNSGAAPDTYDLSDELQYGDGIDVVDAQVVNTQPGTITPRTQWNGETDTLVVQGEPIAAATASDPAVHVYTVTVEVDIDPDIDPAAADCTVGAGESGSGLLNLATVNGDSGEYSDDNCPPTPRSDIDKELLDRVSNGDGTYTVTYELTVAREGTDGTYDLRDELLLSDAVNVAAGPTAVNVTPGGIAVNGGFDGVDDTLVAGGIDIAAGETHTYTVEVDVAVSLDDVTPENSDCTLEPGEAGTGVMNQANLEIDGQTLEDEDCEAFPATTIDKEVASGPTALGNGEYEVVYELTVTNSGAGADVYDLDDELRYGGDVSIVSTTAVNTAPGGITTNGTWDGIGDISVADDVPIAGATPGNPVVHTYEATVVVEVPADLALSDADCTLNPGESGTGLDNEATVTGASGPYSDEDCVPLPSTDIDKTVVDVVGNGDGTWTATYELAVSRTGDGPGYNLVDALQYGDAVSIDSVTAVNTSPGDIATRTGYDGQGDTLVVGRVAIADGDVHTYEVAVVFEVEAEQVTFANSDCTLDQDESGTGLLNTASVEVNDTTDEDRECPPPPAEPVIEKSVTAGPTPVGGGEFQISYEITATNPGAGDGTYTIDDELLYGDGISVVSASVTNTVPGGVATETDWDGVDQLRVVTDVPIAAATTMAPTVHTYVVTVVAEVAADITIADADCDPQTGGADGTGFLNEATLTTNGESSVDEDCVPPPVTDIDKELVSMTANGDGTFTLDYELSVTRSNDGPGYTLEDTFTFGDAVTVDAVTVGNVNPGGVAVNGGFDGESDTRIATNVAINDGETHLYEVSVEVTVDGDAATFAGSDCDLQGESGSGFANTASATSNGSTVSDADCEAFPVIDVDKSTVGTPTALGDGRFEIVYEIDVVNTGAGEGVYNVSDELMYGDGITVLDQSVTNTAPGGIAVNTGWDGDGDTEVVAAEVIGGASDGSRVVHTYTVTVEAEVGGNLAPEATDCTLGQGEAGTGFMNRTTLTGDSGEQQDESCPLPPVTLIDKDLAGINSLEGRRFELVYDLTVERVQGGEGSYTLRDELLLGESLTIENVSAVNVDPGDIDTNDAFDGVNDVVVAAGKTIDDGQVHRYQVVVEVTVDIGAATPDNADCTLGQGEAGTGTMNLASMEIDGVEPNPVEDCSNFPATTHFKDVVDGPTPLGDGNWGITYEITVINAGAAQDVYDLEDTLAFGEGIDVLDQEVSNTGPGVIATNPDWDGIEEVSIVTGEPIQAGTDAGPAVHTYQVEVEAHAPVGIDPAAVDCDLGAGGSGTGFANQSTLSVGPEAETDDGCVPVPVTDIDKELVEVIDNGDGTQTLDYELVVTRTGDGPGYDLVDELAFGEAVTVESIDVANVDPGSVDLNEDFDGVEDTVVAEDVDIADGQSHRYEVSVVASVDAAAVTLANSDCDLQGEAGSGFANTASVTVNDTTRSDRACESLAGVGVDKEVIDGPTGIGNGRHTVTYSVTVTNDGAGATVYDIEDRLAFGDGITVHDVTAVNDQPGGVAVNDDFDGTGQPVIATEVPIDGATADGPATHSYTVTATVEGLSEVTNQAADCTIDDGESGTGLSNTATVTVNGQDSEDRACVEIATAGQLAIDKQVDAQQAGPGGQVSYTVTVQNVGTADYTAQEPAEIEDDLTDVLDDADWAGEAEATSGTVDRDGTTLTWSGPLAVGETVTLTYTVTVDEDVNSAAALVNVVASAGTDANCDSDGGSPECTTATDIVVTEPAPPPAPPAPVTPDPVPVTG
ncbi:DUF6923 family protein [Ornithinicoccus halotolerans]|uniref:DUF6923 family protein n=1 Tax=Ornithinicoccus halotolerans TaxID=1748220 RepID=UPI00188649FE|nr:GEVED domain-containing protein [Ornithinicoccus halotolerans]